MQTEKLHQHSLNWLKDRPTLYELQMDNPFFVAQRLKNELDELMKALADGDENEILDEFTDVANFFASLEKVLEPYGVQTEAVEQHSRYKYEVRNYQKYPAENYQEGNVYEALNKDTNMWAFYQAYLGIPELGKGGEYY